MVYQRGKFWWFRFNYRGREYRESTKQTSHRVARELESRARTRLAEGKPIHDEPSAKIPTLAEFMRDRIEPYARSRRADSKWYQSGMKPLSAFEPLASLPLNEITSEHVLGYAAHRQSGDTRKGKVTRRAVCVASVNRELRVLRRCLRLAAEWGVMSKVPKIQMLKGERRREDVVDDKRFESYLLYCPPLLADVVTVLRDSGARPEEIFRLKWEHVSFSNGRHGTFLIEDGKTASARRFIPMTGRVRSVLETRHINAKCPADGPVFPAATKSGHVEHSTVRKLHARALKDSRVRKFLLYALRHSFATRLAESGCDPFTMCRVMGWATLAIAQRYVHPQADKVLAAFEAAQSNSAMLPA